MPFLLDNEFIIFMAHCEHRTMDGGDTYIIHSASDRARMRECGIQTAHEQPAWSFVEPAQGQYNWAYIDSLINRNRQAGMKSLIQISGWRMPKWMPDNWFPRRANGTVDRETLSIWNEEAQAYSDNYYKTVINRYLNDKDVMFFFGEFQGGEGIYPPFWTLYDEAALADYRSIFGTSANPIPDNPTTVRWFDDQCSRQVLRKARIFYDAYKEIWNCQQYLMNVWTKSFGNNGHLKLMETMRTFFPDAHIVFLQYTYFDQAHDEDEWQYVDDVVKVSQCDVIVEAMFAKGLPMTTPRAIAKGFRGQILHPSASFSFSGESLEQWMLDNIKASHNLWLESRNK